MSHAPLSAISYWNQFLRYSEENNISIDQGMVDEKLAPFIHQDFVPFEIFKDLVFTIWQNSNTPWLGLDFAEKIQLSSHGSLGFAVSHGVDLNECIKLISRYYETRLQAIKLSTYKHAQQFELVLEETCDWEPIRVLLYEVMLYSLVNVLEFIIGKQVKKCRIAFPYPAPEWSEQYHKQLPCEFSFGHRVASISFPSALLNIKSLSPNKQTLYLAASQCDIELAKLKSFDTLQHEVVKLIEQSHHYRLTADEAAQALNLSKSTLTRRLKNEGVSYSEIMTELKKQQAAKLLTTTDSSIESIALSLDYEDSSNFNRSFKRWFNCSPSAYRSEHSLLK